MRFLSLAIFIFSTFSRFVFSVPLENLVSSSTAVRLRSGGEPIFETQLRNPAPVLLPRDNDLRRITDGIINSLEPNVLVEALYLYTKPASVAVASEGWTAEQRTGVFNQLMAVSSMTGLQYYSASRRAMRTFYEYSYLVDGPDSRNRITDPVFTSVPAALTLYARQKDLTFGDNVYRYNYTAARDAVYFTQDNITALTIALIPVINRGNLKTVMAVIDCGDTILIYAVSMAKALSVPGIGDRIGNSFSNRAQAVLNWFSGRLNNTFRPG
jgi:hypothetical protein